MLCITLPRSQGSRPDGARCWRRLCSAFGKASDDLCHALALPAKRMCCNFVDPQILAPLLACRLIALEKMPGVRPIGVVRHIEELLLRLSFVL